MVPLVFHTKDTIDAFICRMSVSHIQNVLGIVRRDIAIAISQRQKVNSLLYRFLKFLFRFKEQNSIGFYALSFGFEVTK